MRWPVDNWSKFNITAGNSYGQKVSYGYHSGVDLNGNGGGNSDCGVELKAISKGVVTSVELRNTGYGNHLHYRIEGLYGTRWVHYAHCLKIFVKSGATLTEGQTIATIGSSGNSNYCHTHWEIKKKPTGINGVAKTLFALNDKWEDPITFVKKNSSIMGIVMEISNENFENLITKANQWDKVADEFTIDKLDKAGGDKVIEQLEKERRSTASCQTERDKARQERDQALFNVCPDPTAHTTDNSDDSNTSTGVSDTSTSNNSSSSDSQASTGKENPIKTFILNIIAWFIRK